MEHLSEGIARLEDEILQQAARIESCEKLILGAKLAIAAGLGWIALVVVGVSRLDGLATTLIVSGVIGGFVVWGSNKSTLEQSQAQMAGLKQRRKDMIDRLQLRDVTLH